MTTDPDVSNTQSPIEQSIRLLEDTTPNTASTRLLSVGGYIFLGVSAFSFTILSYDLWKSGTPPLESSEAPTVPELLLVFSSHLIQLTAALLTALIGYALLRAAGEALREVIPAKDAELIKHLLLNNNTTGLNNYVRLASLSGFVGACTKLGITGLPLATIILTIFFAILGLVPNEASQDFFDLSKLTLGAFIGSFVQRASEASFAAKNLSRRKKVRMFQTQMMQEEDVKMGGSASGM